MATSVADNHAVTDPADPLLLARALVLHDLRVCGADTPLTVSLVEDVLAQRRAWLDAWPAGAPYIAGLVAQDVQEALLENVGRWPACPLHSDTHSAHELYVMPDLGEDPHWVCETDGCVVAPLGGL
jgi:hypothetical protein